MNTSEMERYASMPLIQKNRLQISSRKGYLRMLSYTYATNDVDGKYDSVSRGSVRFHVANRYHETQMIVSETYLFTQ